MTIRRLGRQEESARTRVVAAVSAGWGLLLLARPELPCAVGLAHPDLPHGLVRLLGARRLVQSGMLLIWPRRDLAVGGAAVDVLHALSMLGASRRWPHHRRAALAGATTASFAAAAEIFAARTPG